MCLGHFAACLVTLVESYLFPQVQFLFYFHRKEETEPEEFNICTSYFPV